MPKIASTISICSCPCQPMILPIKFASHIFCILRKFRDFLKPVTVQENTLYTYRSFSDIYHNLMIKASFVLEPSNFTILLLKKFIINIDNKKLCVYKCIFNLTLK